MSYVVAHAIALSGAAGAVETMRLKHLSIFEDALRLRREDSVLATT